MTGTGCNLLLFEDYTTCNSALEVCRNHTVDQGVGQAVEQVKINWRGGRGNFRKQGNIFGHTQKNQQSQKVNATI